MSTPLLEVGGLAVRYGVINAVEDVSLSVAPGSIVSLIGSNGAGKTTSLRAISGLLAPAAGSIRFDGRDLAGVAAETRVAMGLAQVPEGRRVFPRMTVLENLQLGAYLRPGDASVPEDLEAITTLFPILEQRRKQLAGTLSGGEQQMLAIGRALMSRPRLLLMDEPTMGLAPQMVELILERILEIRRLGTTILLVEQNAVEAIRLSDMVTVLRLGRVVHTSPGSEIGDDLLRDLYLGHDV
ncbi:MAG: ABC transporter ATP-binding protein [Rhodobacteraceae bacterium]|nr:ABC transporter ATP-binding protein [Paracoccaceae bacterium]